MNEKQKPMYYGASVSTFQKARQLRNKMTPEETILWERLKGKQLCGVRFRRQHPIYTFIADFYCHEAKLVVELDGKIHLKTVGEDKERTRIMNDFNIKVIRFKNEEILSDIEKVIKQLTYSVKNRLESDS